MGRFSDQVAKFADGTKKQIDKRVRGVTLALFRGVILGTPVDEGELRGAWQTSVGQPAEGDVDRPDKSGAQAIAEILANMGGAGSRSWLTNNKPYSEVVEFGEYPNPPKRGTWVKAAGKGKRRVAGHFEIRSIGGYSKQAPAGMVRVNMARIADILKATEPHR